MTSRPVIRCARGARSLCILIPAVVPLFACLFSACRPELPPSHREPDAASVDGGADLELEPMSPLDAAFPVLRLRLRLEVAVPGPIDLSRVMLVRGQVTPAHLRQIEKGEMSKSLIARVVPAIVWLDDTTPGDTWAILAPVAPLAPGETYAVVGGRAPVPPVVRIVTDGAPPVLPRIWPPVDGGATLALGIWCGEVALPESATSAELAPGGPIGELRRGAVDDMGAQCLRFEADPGVDPGEAGEHGLVGPPVAGGEPPVVSLDPRAFALETEPMPPTAIPCEPGEARFGPGCAAVEDDRIHVRSTGAPLLWAIAGEGLDEVIAARSDDPFVLAPLPPLSAIALSIATIDNAGHVERSSFSATTLAPRPHVILNEVLANPLGAEPAQEWVELYNDSSVPAELAGYVLADVGGETMLPPGTLAPNAFALIVNEAYSDAGDELDPPPFPEALLLRVPKLGNHGLSNTGESIKLLDGGGTVLSRSPAMPVSKAGMSLTRRNPHAPDGLAGSFVSSWPTPGYENRINQEIR